LVTFEISLHGRGTGVERTDATMARCYSPALVASGRQQVDGDGSLGVLAHHALATPGVNIAMAMKTTL
jgi:hypothetical protein